MLSTLIIAPHINDIDTTRVFTSHMYHCYAKELSVSLEDMRMKPINEDNSSDKL